jgi:hypothetical protein
MPASPPSSGPNRLRDEAVPNTFRTGSAAGRTGGAPSRTRGASDRARPPNTLPTAPARRAARARWPGSRKVLVGGVVLAILGIPFFFAPGLPAQEAGIGLICLGAGIAITIVSRAMARDAVATARRSRLAAAGVLVAAPHMIVFGAAGLGLIAFGLGILAIALGVI